jgi:type VI secretion system secreted protein Hcp
MSSDAYMEISDPAVWGETSDSIFGPQGRNLGAFEIFSFEFGANSTREDAQTPSKNGVAGAPAGGTTAGNRTGATPAATSGAAQGQPVVKQFTIKKFIDKASPDLLMACCKAGMPDAQKMEWAIISVREMGEQTKRPYLVLEFQGVWVDAFKWTMSPGSEAADAAQEEEVTFSFETILVKYSRQESDGQHTAVKIKGFNRLDPTQDVPEISQHAQAANLT